MNNHNTKIMLRRCVSESRGGRPGLPVPNKPYGVCGRKATLNHEPVSDTQNLHCCFVYKYAFAAVVVAAAALLSPPVCRELPWLFVYVFCQAHHCGASISSTMLPSITTCLSLTLRLLSQSLINNIG